ncbi:hypothetical protein ACLOAU_14710 [Niabella sp. CJ426]|uniref:hypothetical protein n=1 Tax=Niabella sp. CJ426 TaxID=3393740 RepID=UPI003D023B34
MNKLIITAFILTAFIMVLPVGCRTSKKVARKTETVKVDQSLNADLTKTEKKMDSIKTDVSVKEIAKSDYKNVTYTKSEKEVAVPGFTITSRFSIDTTAKGDTLRFLSQEDDRVKVSVYYDRKSGQAVAEVQNKTRTIKTPFESISITNASSETNKDSKASKAQLNLHVVDLDSQVKSSIKIETIKKEVQKDKKGFAIPFAGWIAITVIVLAAGLWIYFSRVSIWGKIRSLFKK